MSVSTHMYHIALACSQQQQLPLYLPVSSYEYLHFDNVQIPRSILSNSVLLFFRFSSSLSDYNFILGVTISLWPWNEDLKNKYELFM